MEGRVADSNPTPERPPCSEGELVLDMSQYSDGEGVRAALVSQMGGVTLRYSDRELEGLGNKHTSSATHKVTVLLHDWSSDETITCLLGAAGDELRRCGGRGQGEGDTRVQ